MTIAKFSPNAECAVEGCAEPTPRSGGWMCQGHWACLGYEGQLQWYHFCQMKHPSVSGALDLLCQSWARAEGHA